MKRLGWGIFGAVSFVLVTHFAAGCVGDDPAPTGGGGNDGGAITSGAQNGATCGGGGECVSGNCVDGVCCDSACTGTCEACNVPGSVGSCAPIPDGQDPANECPTQPLPEAGPPTTDQDAGDAGDDSGDAAPVDAGPTITLPEAGVPADDTKCAGKCDGKRACRYPAGDTTCGGTYCNDPRNEGRAQCDGKGHCLVGLDDCKAYSCPDGTNACKTTCTSETDCAPGYYCDASGNTCKQKVANASACNNGIQCTSGFCVDGVCCNDGCAIAGGSCAVAGHIGQCVCSACPSGGTCALWYKDADGDGYGDATGTVANGGAAYGCAAGPAPTIAGHPAVLDKTDCYDKGPPDTISASIHPGQTGFFSSSYTNTSGQPSFDYDCDGARTPETAEIVGGSCGFCGIINKGGLIGCASFSTCGTAGNQSSLTCGGRLLNCGVGITQGFTATVACGTTASRVTCGTCSVQAGYPNNVYQSVTQRCR